MLFLVISTPRADAPSNVTGKRQRFWDWVAPLIEAKTITTFHARVGRGAIAVVDVDSLVSLHRILNEWAELIPTQHDVYPLLDGDSAQAYLKVHKPI